MEIVKLTWYILRRRWPVVLVTFTIALISGTIYNSTQSADYTASSSVFLRAPDVKSSASAYQGDMFSRQRATTYMSMIGSDDLAQSVIDKLNLNMSSAELASKVSASTIQSTVVLVISATDPDPQQAADLANGYASVFGSYVAKVENVENDPNIPPLVTVVKTATAGSAVQGGYSLSTVLGTAAAIAAALSILLIWFLEYFDTKIRSRSQVESITGTSVLSTFTADDIRAVDGDSEIPEEIAAAVTEKVERLAVAARRRLSVVGVGERERGKVISVVGDAERTAVPAVSKALAWGLAADGTSVALIGPDVVSQLSSVLTDADTTVKTVEIDGASTSEFPLHELVQELASASDFVIVSAPVTTESALGDISVVAADAAILVVAPGSTTIPEVHKAVSLVGTLGKPMLGVACTDAVETSTVNGAYV